MALEMLPSRLSRLLQTGLISPPIIMAFLAMQEAPYYIPQEILNLWENDCGERLASLEARPLLAERPEHRHEVLKLCYLKTELNKSNLAVTRHDMDEDTVEDVDAITSFACRFYGWDAD